LVGRLGAWLAAATAVGLLAAPPATASKRTGGATGITGAGAKPAWSPNGRQIAFADLAGPETARSWRIYVVGADGSGRRQVVDIGRDPPQSISWSPDGGRLAYDAFVPADQTTNVFAIPAAGGQPTKVTPGWAPAWGPGNRLMIVDRSPDFGDTRLHLVNVDGTGKEEFQPCAEADIGGCFDGHPDWSPNGARITFDTIRGGLSAVWTIDANGANIRQVTPFFPAGASPRWSQDGGLIVYEQYSTAGSVGDIAIMSADGSGSRVVVKDGAFPDLSPDGATIVFARAASLYLVNTDGSNLREITTSPAATPPPAAPTRRCVVPKLAGKTLAAARTALRRANCKTGKVTRVKSQKVRRGRVISSRPKAGTTRPDGAAVALVVSRGRR
jgi:Tol biopolymer transport system component